MSEAGTELVEGGAVVVKAHLHAEAAGAELDDGGVVGLLVSAFLLALPSPDFVVALAFEGVVEPCVLVADAEASGGEPRFDEPADPGGAAPASCVATADEVARILDALQERPAHKKERSAVQMARELREPPPPLTPGWLPPRAFPDDVASPKLAAESELVHLVLSANASWVALLGEVALDLCGSAEDGRCVSSGTGSLVVCHDGQAVRQVGVVASVFLMLRGEVAAFCREVVPVKVRLDGVQWVCHAACPSSRSPSWRLISAARRWIVTRLHSRLASCRSPATSHSCASFRCRRAARRWCLTVTDRAGALLITSPSCPRSASGRDIQISEAANCRELQTFPLPPLGLFHQRCAKLEQAVGAVEEDGEDGVPVFDAERHVWRARCVP